MASKTSEADGGKDSKDSKDGAAAPTAGARLAQEIVIEGARAGTSCSSRPQAGPPSATARIA